MSGSSGLSGRYAKALYELAAEKKIISKKHIIPPIKPTAKKEKEIQEEIKEKIEKAETDKDFQNIGILLPKKKPTIIVKKTDPVIPPYQIAFFLLNPAHS